MIEKEQLQAILAEVRKAFLAGPELTLTPAQINNGWCADFATAIAEKCPGLEICDDEELGAEEYTHTFIRFNGLYYDAECIEGEEDWTQLPVFHRPDELCERCHRTVAEYITNLPDSCV